MTAPTTVVLFGATGDLAKRKLVPGLLHLFQTGLVDDLVAGRISPHDASERLDEIARRPNPWGKAAIAAGYDVAMSASGPPDNIALTVEGYLAAYHDALRQLIAPGWVLSNASLRATVLEWPQGSGRYYDAVTATLTITEIIQ